MVAENVPTPMSLGDFAKLLNGPSPHPALGQLWSNQAIVEPVKPPKTNLETFKLLSRSMASKSVWGAALNWEARDAMSVAYDMISVCSGGISVAQSHGSKIAVTIELLRRIYVDFHQSGGTPNLISVASLLNTYVQKCSSDSLIRMAALISCGIGISAFHWSETHLTPVLVTFRGQQFLALAPSNVIGEGNTYEFYVIETTKATETEKRWTLLAKDRRQDDGYYTLCVFPLDVIIYS